MNRNKESIKIVIVDDSEIDLDILESILVRLGFMNIIRAKVGVDAIQLAKKHQPDIIISDIMMPGMDGGKLREKLREDPETKGIPLIYISAIISKKEEKELGGKLTGGELMISKPYDVDTISRAIDLCLQ
jgi:CheY-like chemotaxis protein